MSESRAFHPDDTSLMYAIKTTEQLGNDYAELMLMDSRVHIDLDDMEAAFTLPPVIEEGFENIGVPKPHLISGMSIDLQYDRAIEQFSISNGVTVFDNGYGVVFADSEYIPETQSQKHRVDLFKIDEQGQPHFQLVMSIATEQMQNYFQQCGIHIPLSPYPATWDAINPILAIARQRTITARRTVPVSANHELQVIDQIIEADPLLADEDLQSEPSAWLKNTMEFKVYDHANTEAAEESAWLREISVQLIEEKDMAVKAIEIVLASDSPLQQPTFRNMYAHQKPRRIASTRNSALNDSLLEQISDGEPITDEQDLIQNAVFIAQAVRAASNGMLG